MLIKLPKIEGTKKAFRFAAVCGPVFLCCAILIAMASPSAHAAPNDFDPELAAQILGSGAKPDQLQKLLKRQKVGGRQRTQQSPLDDSRERGLNSDSFPFDQEEFFLFDEPEPFSSIEKFFIRKIWGREAALRESKYDAKSGAEVFGRTTDEFEIRQFGYGNLNKSASKSKNAGQGEQYDEVPLTGAISDSYVLGIGDEMVVTFLGREEDAMTVRIDREGRLVLPKLPPISAAGRSIGDLRRDLEARVAATLVGTNVFVSLGSVRSISVYVVGEVKEPGLHRLTSLSTILDALVDAGGVLKTGSLRQIEITRGDRRFLLDAYDLFIRGGPNYDLSINDGDRIFVPTVSLTVAVAGDVKRPAIYELPYGRPEISITEALHLSGGPLVPRGNRIVLVSTDAAGREITQEPEDLNQTMIRGGEYLRVISAEGLAGGLITVKGHVNNPGARSLTHVPTIGSLINTSEIFKIDPYLYFAALRRADPRSLLTTLVPINLRPIMDGEFDIGLQNRDVLTIFGLDDIKFMISPEVQKVVRGRVRVPGETDENEKLAVSCPAVDLLASILDGERSERFIRAKYFSRRFGELSGGGGGSTKIPLNENCPEVFRESPELLAFLMEYGAVVSGEVRRPGVYPLTKGTRLSGLFVAAGGLTVEADAKEVEITRSSNGVEGGSLRAQLDVSSSDGRRAVVGPGDTIRVNATYSSQDLGPIIVEGEVRRPGIYNIRRGERLSEIIWRAGGLTEQAFPKGAVFIREAARQEEKRSFQRLADQLQLSLTSNLLVVGGQVGGDIGQVSLAAQQLVTQLREATPVGRVVIEADPTVLEVDPSLDTILQPDDRLHIPKRPNWISVSGAVLNPGTVQFLPGSDPTEYIDMVGGFSDAADEGRVFVVFPDGRAQPVRTSFWNFDSVQLIPGTSVVVPMDATPFRFLPIAREITSIMSQLSIAAASLAVINRN